MKRTLILLVCLLLIPFISEAQVRERLKDKVEAQRVAFLTRQMDLTPEESAAFWPLYNEHRSKLESLRKGLNLDEQRIMNLPDREVDKLLDKVIETEYRKTDLRKAFINDLRGVLPARKILMIEPLERAFNREVLKRIRGEKPGN